MYPKDADEESSKIAARILIAMFFTGCEGGNRVVKKVMDIPSKDPERSAKKEGGSKKVLSILPLIFFQKNVENSPIKQKESIAMTMTQKYHLPSQNLSALNTLKCQTTAKSKAIAANTVKNNLSLPIRIDSTSAKQLPRVALLGIFAIFILPNS